MRGSGLASKHVAVENEVDQRDLLMIRRLRTHGERQPMPRHNYCEIGSKYAMKRGDRLERRGERRKRESRKNFQMNGNVPTYWESREPCTARPLSNVNHQSRHLTKRESEASPLQL